MSKPKRIRRQFTTEQKADILHRHMVDKLAVSDLCDELKIQPSLFYHWQRQMLENLAAALNGPQESGPSRRERELAAASTRLTERLAKKDSVIAEISAAAEKVSILAFHERYPLRRGRGESFERLPCQAQACSIAGTRQPECQTRLTLTLRNRAAASSRRAGHPASRA